MKGTGFKNISDLHKASELSLRYNLAVAYDKNENSYFAVDNKEADIFATVLTTNGITFDRFIDPLY